MSFGENWESQLKAAEGDYEEAKDQENEEKLSWPERIRKTREKEGDLTEEEYQWVYGEYCKMIDDIRTTGLPVEYHFWTTGGGRDLGLWSRGESKMGFEPDQLVGTGMTRVYGKLLPEDYQRLVTDLRAYSRK